MVSASVQYKTIRENVGKSSKNKRKQNIRKQRERERFYTHTYTKYGHTQVLNGCTDKGSTTIQLKAGLWNTDTHTQRDVWRARGERERERDKRTKKTKLTGEGRERERGKPRPTKAKPDKKKVVLKRKARGKRNARQNTVTGPVRYDAYERSKIQSHRCTDL